MRKGPRGGRPPGFDERYKKRNTVERAINRHLLRSHLKAIRSPFRSLPAGRIAVLVLAMLRHDQRLLDLAHGNGVPESPPCGAGAT
ncbi:hypothetical protein [Streptomyces sp. NBC_01443]|uniref:hypothetical protein n=1 Tax=Streptomyces sp. NBC_01443 TaxID=2903868 RepID=UPI00224CE6D6|nr:hypothetical protein [Streptomyces sp. NBC_01443]MCX4625331.1 hypothetical protein [Streptomyces sp. NBC_01443]